MVNYIYKIKSKYLKLQKDGSRLIESFGFVRFENEEAPDEIIYAMPVKVSPESVIVRGLIADLNNPDWQRAANITHYKRKAALKKEGLEWEKQPDGAYKVIETEEMINEFSQAHLCVSAENVKTIPHGVLLIKGGDGIMRGSSNTLETACKNVIDDLIEKGIVYRKRLHKIRKKSVAKA